ncbi:MAG TPA: DUF6279 family lipoprotein [Burkholderiales bacterium]|nr:DUF6279 family lipoprotein [Burkholderiales bacterium]
MRFVTLWVLACALCGCSTLRFAYENADTYLRWRLGSYLDVQGEAAEELDERIDSFLDWHRAQALPKYARIAAEAGQRFGDKLSPEDLVWGYDVVMTQARESLRAGAEKFAPMLDRLTPKQVAHMEQRFAEENRKFAREHLRGSERERKRRRALRIIDRLEDWVGTLSQAQVERVKQFSEHSPLTDEHRDRDRKRLQADVLTIVRAREAQTRLPGRLADWQAGRDPAFSAANDALRRDFYALLLDLDRSLSAEQRARALAQLRRYGEDFQVLASRPR